jgi:hypothetical protein
MKTSSSRLFVAASSLVLALACGVAPEEGGVESGEADGLKSQKTPVATTSTYALQTTDVKVTTPVFKSSYVVTSTYELFYAVDLPSSLKGRHSLSIFVNAAGGSSYQRMDVKFTTDIAAGIGEQKAEKLSNGAYRVWASMPVAGTMIEQYGLVGTWSAADHIDGDATAAATTTFQLQ